MNFHVFMWKSRKKLESHARVDFTGGCKSIVFHKVLGAVSPPWGGILLNYQILWKCVEFHHISWKWCDFTPFSAPWGGNGARAAPGQKHQRNLCFSYAFLGVPGTQKLVSGWISTKKQFRVLFLVKITKMGGIPRNSTIFTHFPTSGRSPRPGLPERHGIYMYYKGSGKVRRGQEEMLILHVLPWFHIISLKIMILHEFLGFLVIFMILHENHENWDPPAPGRRNSMYYCTISHDMGSSFRWIPIIFMFFHEIH